MKFKILDVEFDTRSHQNRNPIQEDKRKQKQLAEEWIGEVIEIDDLSGDEGVDYYADAVFKWFERNTGWLFHNARLKPLDFQNMFPQCASEYWDYSWIDPASGMDYPDNFFRLQTIVVLPSAS